MKNSEVSSDDIDISSLLNALIKQKWIILIFIFFGSVGGVSYSLSLPNLYTSNVQLMPEKGFNSGGTSGVSALTGGLSMLGLSQGEQDSQVSIALKLLEGNSFLGDFLQKYALEAEFFAVKSWVPSSNTLVYDEKLFDGKLWLREKTALKGKEPTKRELSESFRNNNLSFSIDEKTGFITISLTHVSPYIAQSTLESLVFYVNERLRDKAMLKSDKKISYLKSAIASTNDAEIKAGFIKMIVAEEKEKMLISVSQDYVFTIIDSAALPTEKSSPKRAIITVVFLFFSSAIGIAIALMRSFYFQGENK